MSKEPNNKVGVSMDEYLTKMDLLDVKLEQINRKLSNKADDVVSIQLLQHRRELEDLYSAVAKMEAHIKLIDEELSLLIESQPAKSMIANDRKNTKKVTPLFT